MMYKNWLVSWRSRRAFFIQLFAPVAFVLLLFCLQLSFNANNATNELTRLLRYPNVTQLSGIPRCTLGKNLWNASKCYTFAFEPANDPVVVELMQAIAQSAGIPNDEWFGMNTSNEIDEFLFVNQNTTQGVYHVTISPDPASRTLLPNGRYDLSSVSYTIQFNYTDTNYRSSTTNNRRDILLPMQIAFQQAIFNYTSQALNISTAPKLSYSALEFPHPQFQPYDAVGRTGPSMFLAAMMFNFVIQLGNIVNEKEKRLREAMAVMGGSDFAYWITWTINNLLWNTASTLVLICAGLAFQFEFFLENDFGTYFFLFFFFGAAMATFALFLSLFIKSTPTATSIGFVLYLVSIMGQVAAHYVFDSGTALYVQWIISLLPASVLGKGVNDLGTLSAGPKATGLRWADRNDYAFFTMKDAYGRLAFDFALYLVLTLFLDFLFGGVRSESRMRYLINKLSKSKKPAVNRDNIDTEVKKEERRVLKNKLSEETLITIKHLTKTYKNYKAGCVHQSGKDFTAVNDLLLHMEDKRLFCLLGHNGAGKSTTISMLTGLCTPSFGDADILGYSLRKDIDQIRNRVGVCPQFDILWDELTGGEHIQLFAAMRGIPRREVQKEIQDRLEDVDLLSARSLNSGAYSGGMKRRLSVAIALTGNPRIVYLDEPTTGMDPLSRRQVWNLLEREKSNRLVVLTTHSMEEADLLGDVIGIMKEGRLQTIGTSLELKTKFGKGYSMTLVCDKGANAAKKLVSARLPSAELDEETSHATFLHYVVPFSLKSKLPAFFEEIETNGAKYKIDDVQIGLTSLEDVFLRVAGHEDEEDNDEAALKTSRKSESSQTQTDDVRMHNMEAQGSEEPEEGEGEEEEEIDEDETEEEEEEQAREQLKPKKDYKFKSSNQLRALFAKSLRVQQRQYGSNFCQLMFPVAIIVFLFGTQQLLTKLLRDSTGLTSIPAIEHPYLTPSFFIVPADFDVLEQCPVPDVNTTFQELFANVKLDLSSGQMIFADARSSPVFPIGNYVPADKPFASNLSSGSGLLDFVTHNWQQDMLAIKAQTLPEEDKVNNFCEFQFYTMPIRFFSSPSQDEIVTTLFDAYAREIYAGGYVFNAYDTSQLDVTIVYNKSLTAGRDLVKLVDLITQAYYKSLYGSQTALQFVGTRDFPTVSQPLVFDLFSNIGPFIYMLIFQLMFPVFLGRLVQEKEAKLREIMKMMGLHASIYWVMNYIVFLLFYIVAISIMLLLASLLGYRMWTVNHPLVIFIQMFLYANVIVAMALFAQSFFSKGSTAVVFGYILVFGTAMLASLVLNPYFANPSTPPATIFGISLFPPLAFYRGIFDLSTSVQFGAPGIQLDELGLSSVSIDDSWKFMVVEWAVLMLFALYFDRVIPDGSGVKQPWYFPFTKSFWSSGKRNRHTGEMKRREPEQEEAPAIAAERERVWQPECTDTLRILDLRKVYPKPRKVAVENLSLGIHPNECFGLLGPNGSGKSTTLNVLNGYATPSAGTAIIDGLNLVEDSDAIHLRLGVCPQDNVIWDDLTGREHLLFYGRLKNLSGKALRKEVRRRLEEVDLWWVRDKKAGKYSGGMKRRLCVAIAMMGSPPLILLDEPTTGLDPKAKQRLWNVIRMAKTHSSVLTTTHSMEEAEALCSRVGIFVDGKLRLVGPPAVLKSDYGEHFKLNITVNPEDDEAAHTFISNRFPTAEVFNSPVLGTTIYQLSRDSVSLSDLFSGCLELEEELQVNTWGISNITLEEVFLKITLEILDKGSDFLKTEGKKSHVSNHETQEESDSSSEQVTSLYSQ